MLLHIPDYVGGMQLITCPTVESKTDEHKANSKVLSVSLDKGETSCIFLLVTRFYSVLIAEVVGCFGHFRKWTTS